MSGRIGWLFGLGHGHYTQLLNFQECFPQEQTYQAEWIPLINSSSGDWINKLPFTPGGIRFRRNQLWHAKSGVARHDQWDALFFAGIQRGFLPIVRRYRSYIYEDLTPSLRRELSPWYDHQINGNRLVQNLKEHLHRRIFQASRGVFAMSQWAASGIRRDYRLPARRVHVVLPGANLRRWHFVDRDARSLDRPVRILMVGGQFQLKGGLLMLDWAERSQARGWELDIVTWPGELPDWVRDCLGNPAAEDRVSRSLAPRLPRVRVHCGLKANTPEIMRLFEDADVFCLPTQADGSSIASLEAMASGLPVLVGAVGGIPELVQDGVTGFLLRRGDPDDLASKLERLIQDKALRNQIGRAARKSCEDYFNVERQLREILAVIDTDRAQPSD